MIQGLDVEAMEDLAGRAATSVCRRIPGSSWEDLKQDGIVWMLSHVHKLEEWTEDPDQGYGKTFRSVCNELFDLAGRDKAERSGYHHTDNFYYSLAMLRRILPLYYMDKLAELDYETVQELDLPDRDAYLDVEAGLRKVTMAHRQALFAWYGEDRDTDEVAVVMADVNGITVETARKRMQRMLAKLQGAIGGEAPSQHKGRRAVSNAQARAITGSVYDAGQ